ncbi:MAG: zinc-binding dehydrogenase [Anaerolineales bacterium]|nr:zinc-binding dehydrogenase [Anaerolineales bacterium]
MRSAFFQKHGGPEVMEVGELTQPVCGPDDVLVNVKAVALNRLDKWVRDGWPGLKLALPHVGGSDGAGVVAEVGARVTGWQAGNRVVINSNMGCGQCAFCAAGQDNWCENWHLLGETIPGFCSEFIAVPPQQLLKLPPAVTFEQAAAAGLVYQTAWHSLITRGGLRAGESVLVVGAAGGVNTASIQIAKLAGCTVYVVGSDAKKLALAQALGADVLIDRSQVEWGKEVYKLTHKRGVDVVVDNVGATTMLTSLRCARKGGRILTVGNTAGPKFELDNRFIFGKHLSLIGSTMSTRADYATVMHLVFSGALKPVIDSVMPLAEIRAAHEKLEQGDVLGKIVLTLVS